MYQADSMSTQQIPNMSIVDQDLVRVQLHTKVLGGLSFRDLQLAHIIDSFDLQKYKLVALNSELNYKKVIRRKRIEEEMKRMEQEIISTEGSRFGNKFKETDKIVR